VNSSSTHISEQFYPYPVFKVDTVRCHFESAPWKTNIPDDWDGWKTQYNRGRDRSRLASVSERPVAIMMTHRATGLRVGGNQFGAAWFEVSVPHFVHGDNSILITTEEELSAAKKAISEAITQVCHFDSSSSGIRVVRIDLVAYIPVPLNDVIAAHRSCRHPKFHKSAAQYVGESLVFKGSLRICRMYSSELLKTGTIGTHTRVEWQLRQSAIARDFGAPVCWNQLRLEDCYRVYRELCLGFDCSEIPKINTIYHFLAIAEQNDWQWEGVPAIDLYLHHKKKSSVNRIRRKVAVHRPTVFKFKWNDLLPLTYTEQLQQHGK
jgi:hypothetical protein